MNPVPIKLGLLISGGGRTALNLHECIERGALDATIATVVSSRAAAAGVRRLNERGLAVHVVERSSTTDDEFHARLGELLACVDLVCMCGFLSLWRISEAFVRRVINIHPALLPKFGGPGMFGRRLHEAVIAAGETESGCTVHFCDNEYDHGPIILQRKVAVDPSDTAETLAARVFAAECEAYPAAIRLVARAS